MEFRLNAFRQFVVANERWFRGRGAESEATLRSAEETLGVRLPDDIRWLLSTYGYWHATGISSLDETITDTQAARTHLGLPERFVVLYNHQDGGAILLDTIADSETGENKVFNVAWESIPHQLADEIVYDSYLPYVDATLAREREFIAEEYIDYDPAAYRNG
jgi:SUKH superfamily protein